MDFDPAELLAKPLMAYLATASPDGPRSSPVWFLWEEKAVWLIGNEEDSFPKRLRTDPRCAVSVVDFDVEHGILRHVGIRGRAQILPLDQPRLHRMLARYLGADPRDWNDWFKANVVDGLELMIRIAPETAVAKDMSYFKTGPVAR
jgi:uncharacterized pyridoxamine 5'-phosphate oxidase family protein